MRVSALSLPVGIVCLLLLLLCGCNKPDLESESERTPFNIIYVVDTSGSMQRDGLYGRLMAELESRYLANLDDDDHCVIMTFDSDTRERYEFNRLDRPAVGTAISELRAQRPTGQYTNLTQAVYDAARKAQKLREQYPRRRTEIYLFTDGKQDPPPGATGPTDWQAVLSDRLAGAMVQHPDVGIYFVALPGSELSGLPPGIDVITAPPDRSQLAAPELRFERVHFDVAGIKIRLAKDGSIPPERVEHEVDIEIKVAKSTPTGEPKDIVIDTRADAAVEPRELRFTRSGQRSKLRIRYSVSKQVSTHEIVMPIRPATRNLVCDEALTVRVPLTFEPYRDPFGKRLMSWFFGLPTWLLLLLGLAVLLLLLCALVPKFKRQTITTGGVTYRLRRRASFCGHRCLLGTPRGVPMGDGSGPIAVLTAAYGGRVNLRSKRPGIRVNGQEVTKNFLLTGFATIEHDGAVVEYSES